MSKIKWAFLLVLVMASPWSYSQVDHLEFADKPRLVECKDQPCFRVLLNAVDAQGQPAAVSLETPDPLKGVSVWEGTQKHPVFYLRSLSGEVVSHGTYTMILIDASGSMNRQLPGTSITRFEAARQALRRYLTHFREGVDHLAIVPFESHQVASRIRNAVFSETTTAVQSQIALLPEPESRNNTALLTAIYEGLAVLKKYKDQGYQVSLTVLTDGKNDVSGSTDDPGLFVASDFHAVWQRADEMRIQIVTIGFGERGASFDEKALRALAWPSESNYYYAGDQTRLEQIFGAAREKLTNRIQLTFGPVRADKNELSGQSLLFRVFLVTKDGKKLESRNEPAWSSPAIGSPSYEGTLDRDELAAFILRPVDQVDTNPFLSRLIWRSVITLIFAGILAFLWFGLPRLIWPERYAQFPTVPPPVRVPRPPVPPPPIARAGVSADRYVPPPRREGPAPPPRQERPPQRPAAPSAPEPTPDDKTVFMPWDGDEKDKR
jgi:Mg-chelatase subunit ChlD